MTWDHIATAIVGGGATLIIPAVAAVGGLLLKPLRRVPRGTEAEGFAIEVFPYVGRCGRTTECPQPPCTQPGNPRCAPSS